ncbi:MAG: hypothetical protein M9945_14120 [Aquamicrobium sp.]|uniref:hypothetical protein n=1 Tax=Aquamicrobium sp. TaxID=1872579 RepID=UPI00349EA3DB|nr:hypothetical protein [Aquamicrobium sp.]
MAVKFNVFDAKTVLIKLGVSQEQVDWLTKHHVKVSLTSSDLMLAIPSEDFSETTEEFHTHIGLNVMVALKNGSISAAQTATLQSQLQGTISHIQEKHGAYLANLPEPPEGWKNPITHQGTLGKLPQLQKTPLTYADAKKQAEGGASGAFKINSGIPPMQAASKVTPGWQSFDLDKIKTADLVKLRDATLMYQPVHGSSAGSRYFMVAGNSSIRVAARYKGGTLSIRLEGPGLSDHKKKIEAIGFSKLSKSEQYASVHLDVGGDLLLANKTLGAFLVGLGVSLETPIPDLALIA